MSSENTVSAIPHIMCMDAVHKAEILFTTQKQKYLYSHIFMIQTYNTACEASASAYAYKKKNSYCINKT